VGEERGSDGARAANTIPNECRFLVNGEPTDSRLGAATRGAFRVKLAATGRAAHSSYPEAGESAIDKLLDALMRLRAAELPAHPMLGRTHYTVGLISGGIAPNVIPPNAEAEVMFRTVGPSTALRPALDSLGDLVSWTTILDVPAVELTTMAGFETAVFPFTTDIPFLDKWGEPLLIGPGSIFVAHTDHEYVELAELEAAVDKYAALGRTLPR
jgi:acetylornithine deacetylase